MKPPARYVYPKSLRYIINRCVHPCSAPCYMEGGREAIPPPPPPPPPFLHVLSLLPPTRRPASACLPAFRSVPPPSQSISPSHRRHHIFEARPPVRGAEVPRRNPKRFAGGRAGRSREVTRKSTRSIEIPHSGRTGVFKPTITSICNTRKTAASTIKRQQ